MDIREVIDAYVDDVCLYPVKGCEFYKGDYCVSTEGAYKCLMKRLGELGVVKKVKCPKCGGHAMPNKVTYTLHEGYCINGHSCPNCNNTGYVAVEPLI